MATDLKDQDYSTLYVEFDSLFDTRFPCLLKMGEDVATKVIDLGYHERVTDFYPGVDYEAYQRLYDARDKSILRNAVVTPILQLIEDFAKSTLENVGSSPFQYVPKLEINTHPYVLDEEEINFVLGLVYKRINKLMEISIIHKPMEEITPYFVKNRYTVMVMYRYDRWLEHHAKNKKFEKTTVPEVTMISPAVYFLKQDTIPEDVKPVFEDMQATAEPLIGLQLFPAEIFSMVLKPRKKSANTQPSSP